MVNQPFAGRAKDVPGFCSLSPFVWDRLDPGQARRPKMRPFRDLALHLGQFCHIPQGVV